MAIGHSIFRIFSGPVVAGVLIGIWQASILIFDPPRFLLPSPGDVFAVFYAQSPFLFAHFLITAKEMLLGLAAGGMAGIAVALLLRQSPLLERVLMPVVVGSQTLPVFAIAPLLVIWFGFGIVSKVVMASLIIFFPVASAFHDGLRRTPAAWSDLAKTWGATRGQTLRHIAIPAAFPSLSSGLRIAATVAPIGAVVGEWAGAAGGLGFVMLQANARTQTDVVFASLIMLALAAFLLRAAVVQLTALLLLPPGPTGENG